MDGFIMTLQEWTCFISGGLFGVILSRAVANLFWRLTFSRRYKRRH